jgi:hypothetical protein
MTTSKSDIAALALSVTKKHGIRRCRECATELREVLATLGKKGCVLRLKTRGGRGYIVMKDPTFLLPFTADKDEAIATSGQHFGVLVGGLVYDNIFQQGISRSAWENSFACDIGTFDVEEIEPF